MALEGQARGSGGAGVTVLELVRLIRALREVDARLEERQAGAQLEPEAAAGENMAALQGRSARFMAQPGGGSSGMLVSV